VFQDNTRTKKIKVSALTAFQEIIKRTPKKQIASPVPMANTRLNIPMRLEVLRAKRALLEKKAIQVVPVHCVRRVSFAPQTTV